MLSGRTPFCGSNDTETMCNVSKGIYDMNSLAWDNVSESAKYLVSGLLEMNPEKRLSAKEALESEWIQIHMKTASC